jgi:hypothetical protein
MLSPRLKGVRDMEVMDCVFPFFEAPILKYVIL